MRQNHIKYKKHIIIGMVLLLSISLAGCQSVRQFFKNVQTEILGIHMTVKSYDESSQVIDKFSGKVGNVTRDVRMDTENMESSVITFTVGGREVQHVGSSMI
ncbi:MAG: DUF5052 family protein, partial [Tissierellia bacterium]|nr:DUF5052 family protein [Tissierellia bacterium]